MHFALLQAGLLLCERDACSGQNHEHRKGWIKQRIRELAAGYAVEVSACAIMSNHLHLVGPGSGGPMAEALSRVPRGPGSNQPAD